MTFLEAVHNLAAIVGKEGPDTLDELDCILVAWRASLDEPQPSSPQWIYVDGPFEDRSCGASRTSPDSEPSPEPAASMQTPCQPHLKRGDVVKSCERGVFGQIVKVLPDRIVEGLPTSGSFNVRFPNGSIEDCRKCELTAVAIPTNEKTADSNIYVVTRGPEHARFMLGVWQVPWRQMSKLLFLPPQGLRNSGFHLKRCDTVLEAMTYWKDEGHASDAPLHFD